MFPLLALLPYASAYAILPRQPPQHHFFNQPIQILPSPTTHQFSPPSHIQTVITHTLISSLTSATFSAAPTPLPTPSQSVSYTRYFTIAGLVILLPSLAYLLWLLVAGLWRRYAQRVRGWEDRSSSWKNGQVLFGEEAGGVTWAGRRAVKGAKRKSMWWMKAEREQELGTVGGCSGVDEGVGGGSIRRSRDAVGAV